MISVNGLPRIKEEEEDMFIKKMKAKTQGLLAQGLKKHFKRGQDTNWPDNELANGYCKMKHNIRENGFYIYIEEWLVISLTCST